MLEGRRAVRGFGDGVHVNLLPFVSIPIICLMVKLDVASVVDQKS